MRPSRWQWSAALVAAGLAAYWPGLRGVFTFDDYPWILYNPHLGNLWSLATQNRPLTLLTFALNLALGGPDPLGFHLVNLAIHLGATVLVFALIAEVVPERPWIAAAGAAIFLLHPAQADAVTYVSGRATSLMTLLLVGAHLAAVRAVARGERPWLSVALYAMAVAAKEVAVIYPLALFGWLIARGERPRAALRAIRTHLAAASLLLAALVLHPGYRALLGDVARGALAGGAIAVRIEGLAGLARVLVAPWTVSIDHGRSAVGAAEVMIALVVLAALALALVRKRDAAAGAAWIAAALLPTPLLLARTDPVSDRMLYLPMVGVAVIAAAGLRRVQPRPALALVAALVMALGILSGVRNAQFQSEVVLWEDAARKNPENPRARVNLGYAYELAGDPDRAEREYLAALALQPGLWWAERGLRAVAAIRGARGGGSP